MTMKTLFAIGLLLFGYLNEKPFYENHLNGKVKEIRTQSFELKTDENGKEIEELKEGGYKYEYNESGQVVKLHLDLLEGKYQYYTNFYYNELGQLVSTTENDLNHLHMSTHKMDYSTLKNLKSITILDKDKTTKELITFKKANSIIEEVSSADTIFFKYHYNGNILIKKEKLGKSGILLRFWNYKYNTNGLDSLVEVGGKFGVFRKFRYEYNQNGDKIKRESIERNGKTKTREYKYTYDEANNWITKIYVRKDKRESITKREIIYF